MEFQVFDTTELEQYKQEAKERWGQTAAYQEYERRGEKSASHANALMVLFAELGSLRNHSPQDGAAQEKVKEIQDFITDHYYTCTKEIFRGLGQMYTGDERMKKNIDKAGGEGTAEFARQAIAFYCAK